MTDGGPVMVMGPCQSGKSGESKPRLYNFVTDTTEPVDLAHLTDAQAVELLPQHPVAQSVYTLLRAQGYPILEALIEILKIQLVSGGQRKFIHVRDGGRG
jgi:hypothetical protein